MHGCYGHRRKVIISVKISERLINENWISQNFANAEEIRKELDPKNLNGILM